MIDLNKDLYVQLVLTAKKHQEIDAKLPKPEPQHTSALNLNPEISHSSLQTVVARPVIDTNFKSSLQEDVRNVEALFHRVKKNAKHKDAMSLLQKRVVMLRRNVDEL